MGSRCKPCGRKGIETDDHTRVVRRAPRLPSLGSRVYEDHGEQIAGGNALACVMGLPPETSNPKSTLFKGVVLLSHFRVAKWPRAAATW